MNSKKLLRDVRESAWLSGIPLQYEKSSISKRKLIFISYPDLKQNERTQQPLLILNFLRSLPPERKIRVDDVHDRSGDCVYRASFGFELNYIFMQCWHFICQ